MKRYSAFFYFRALSVLLLTVMFSGCGSEAGNSEQNYSNQLVEATMPADTGENLPHINPVRIVAKNVYLGKENIGGTSEIELIAKLEKIAAKNDIMMRDAYYDAKTWVLKKERVGIMLDISKVKNAALSADSGKKIKYAYVNIKPHIKEAQLKGKVKQISKFTTPILDRSKSRVKNIRLAAKKIDYKIILPNEEFSFNLTTGSKTKKKGYEDATVIVNTPKGPKHKKAPGGGVCQLSTTLYNAVLKCHMKVTERHEHSDDVHYVPDGKDATVSYNGADFKFINNRKNPIMLRVYVGKRTVRVMILENSGLYMKKG